VGAKIAYHKKEVFECDILVKSAPISEAECALLKPNQFIISPIHLSVMKREILQKMMEKKITALSFENLKDDTGHNPIVRSMSEIAGSAVMLIAGQYLSKANNGKGVLVGGISGIPPTKVIIIGAGIVGEYAARTALAIGASVKIFDNSIYRLKRLQNNIGGRLWTSVIEPKILAKQLKTCDVAVGALSSSNGRTPIIVSEEMVGNMRPGSIIVDVSIDRGGCFETSEVTTHEKPIFRKFDVIHYCVPNIPSLVSKTSSLAISNLITSFVLKTGKTGGIEEMLWQGKSFMKGVYCYKGHVTHPLIGKLFKKPVKDIQLLLMN
jgi:alanine dehydrogenase